VAVPEGSSGELIECTACGIYIERSSERIPAASAESDTSIPPTADEDIERESPEEPEGVDRRLIILISAVAVIAVVGLVLLVVMLRPSRPQEEVADTGETLRIISWEGNLPDDNIYEFEEYVSKKYNETIKVERIYASEEKDFFNAIYGRKADVSLAPHNFIKDE